MILAFYEMKKEVLVNHLTERAQDIEMMRKIDERSRVEPNIRKRPKRYRKKAKQSINFTKIPLFQQYFRLLRLICLFQNRPLK